MRTLLPYIGALIAAALAMFVLAQIGEIVRAETPVPMHLPLAVAGAVIVIGSFLSLAIFEVPPFAMSILAWRISMVTGLAVGLLMFSCYVSVTDCTLRARGGMSCRVVSPG